MISRDNSARHKNTRVWKSQHARMSGSHNTHVWKSQHACLEVTTRVSGSHNTRVWKSQHACLEVTTRMSGSHNTRVWKSQHACLEVTTRMSGSHNTRVWKSQHACLEVKFGSIKKYFETIDNKERSIPFIFCTVVTVIICSTSHFGFAEKSDFPNPT